MFVGARTVFDNVSDAGSLCVIQVLDESRDLGEGLASGVFGASVPARIRVWLTGWAGDDEVYPFWEGV